MRTSATWERESLATRSVSAAQILGQLDWLLNGDGEERKSARRFLYCELANQGHLDGAAAPAVDIIAEHVRRGRALNAESVSLLEVVLNSRNPGLVVHPDGEPRDGAEYCRERILDVLPDILAAAAAAAADGRDAEYFREVCFLVPQLADSSPEVIDFLRASMATVGGESKERCAEAVEEAEDVIRDGHMP